MAGVPVLLSALALAGCGPFGGGSSVAPPPRRLSPAQQAQRDHEYPSPPAPPPRVAWTSPSATTAVRSFAQTYINWDPQTVTARLLALAGRSVGQARSAMQLAAAQSAGDYELQRGGIANHGTVEAVAPLAGQPGRFAVVTRELTTATLTTAYEGLRPAWHVTIVTVLQVAPGRWAVSGWQPET